MIPEPGTKSSTADAGQIAEWLRLIVDSTRPVELRAIGRQGGIQSGFFDDLDKMAAAAVRLESWSKGIYFVLNPIAKIPPGRKLNVVERGKCTADADILERRWLPVDVDPVRKADTSSTDSEKQEALWALDKAIQFLLANGFSGSIVGDSGNGGHAMFPIRLSPDDASKQLVESFFKGLAKRFDTKAAHFDTSVGNASRIWKLYGTLSRKGDSTAERPHRRSKIIAATVTPESDCTEALRFLVDCWQAEDTIDEEQKTSAESHPGNGDAFKRTATNGSNRYAQRALDSQANRVRTAPHGQLWYTLRSAACSVGRYTPHALQADAVLSRLLDAARDAGAVDLDHAEKTARSGIKAGGENPRTMPSGSTNGTHHANGTQAGGKPGPSPQQAVPAFKPFPVHALPLAMQTFVSEAADAIGCDPCFIALPAITIAGGLVGGARWVQLKRRWKEAPIFWTTTVADPSSMKTPALNQVRYPLLNLQQKLDRQFSAAFNAYTEELAAWEARQKANKDEDPGPEPTEPKKREIFLTDVTIERLAEILQDNPRGALLVRDELSAWFNSFGKYKGKSGGSDAPNWLELWQAGVLKVHRKMAVPRDLFVPKAMCAITGTIQPRVLASAFTSDLFDAGAPFRVLFCMPPTRQKVWRETDISEEAEDLWTGICEFLANLEGEHFLGLSKDAKALWIEFFNRNAERQFDEHGPMRAALGKIEAYAARLALVHYLIGCAFGAPNQATGPVPAESMAAGIELADWFSHEAERVFLMLVETDDDSVRRALVEKIRVKGGRITARELQRSNQRRYRTVEDATAVLEDVVTHGLGKWVQDGQQKAFVLTDV